jgi:hypothetical protein
MNPTSPTGSVPGSPAAQTPATPGAANLASSIINLTSVRELARKELMEVLDSVNISS